MQPSCAVLNITAEDRTRVVLPIAVDGRAALNGGKVDGLTAPATSRPVRLALMAMSGALERAFRADNRPRGARVSYAEILSPRPLSLIGINRVCHENASAKKTNNCRCDLDHPTRPYARSLRELTTSLSPVRFQKDFVNFEK